MTSVFQLTVISYQLSVNRYQHIDSHDMPTLKGLNVNRLSGKSLPQLLAEKLPPGVPKKSLNGGRI